jgi:signal transduction histidine kinase
VVEVIVQTMQNRGKVATYYAPIERADSASVQADRLKFEEDLLLKEVLSSLSEILLVLNQQRQIVFANQPLLELLGITELDFLLGMRPGEALLCQHADAMDGGCGTSEFCRECGAARAILTCLRGQENVQECRILRTDGDALDLRVQARPLRFGHRSFVLFSLNDIGHEKRRLALESIFLHDGSAEDVSAFKDTVLPLALTLVEEIRAQQFLLAAESGELAVKLAPVDAVEILWSVGSTYRSHPVCAERGIDFAGDSSAATLVCDPALLRRVLGNMIKNALEATPSGGAVTISCYSVDNARSVEFSVHNPTAMSRATQIQVFNRSFSTKGNNRGLGTYSMKLLTERYLHGSVRFTTGETEGTTFFARYPRAFGAVSPAKGARELL